MFTEEEKKELMDWVKYVGQNTYTVKVWVTIWSVIVIGIAAITLYLHLMK